GAAVHPVDEVLHVVGELRLQPDGGHLVAAAVLEEVHRADDAVGDEVVDQHALSAAPGAFDPGVVVLLVGQGVVGRPVLEGGPPHRVAPTVAAVGDEVEHGERAVGVVLGAVLERLGDAAVGERLAADEPAAERLVGHDVVVRVDEPAYLSGGVRALERLAGDADPRVRGRAGRRVPPVAVGGGARCGTEGRGQDEQDQGQEGDWSASAGGASNDGHGPRPSVGGRHGRSTGGERRPPTCHDRAQYGPRIATGA